MAFNQYRGRNIGRLMRFLYEYDMGSDAYGIFSSNNRITYRHDGPLYATYTWDGDTDVPTFEFHGQFAHLNKVQEQKKPRIVEYELMYLYGSLRVMYPIASADRVIYTESEVKEKPAIGMIINVWWNGKSERRVITSIEDGVLYTKKWNTLTEKPV